MPIGRGGVRPQRRRVYIPPSCARPPPLCRAATSPPAGGEKIFESNFLPPLGGRCRRQRGGAPAAPTGVHTAVLHPPAPPLSRCDLSPRWGRKNFRIQFSPPLGGEMPQAEGGCARSADGCAYRRPARARPPSVALRPLPPLGEKKFSNPIFSPPWGGCRRFPNFLPPLGGRCRRQRGGARAAPTDAPTAVLRPPAPPLSRCDISPRWGEKNF